MKLEELKNELPETPDFIHNMIREEVEKQVTKTNIRTVKGKAKPMRRIGYIVRGLAACAALALIVGGVNHLTGKKTEEESHMLAGNIFAITAYAAELPEGVSGGDVLGISTFEATNGGSQCFLSNRFAISGENIEGIKITTDKCNLYAVKAIYENDPEFSEVEKAESDGETEVYVMIPDEDIDEETNTKPVKFHYEHMKVVGPSYEAKYDEKTSFGLSVPKELWSTNEDIKIAYYEDVDQVNGATLSVEVTFTDGSVETHHYRLKTGKIFVPADENQVLQWDKLTRFVTSEEETFAYGFLMEKID